MGQRLSNGTVLKMPLERTTKAAVEAKLRIPTAGHAMAEGEEDFLERLRAAVGP